MLFCGLGVSIGVRSESVSPHLHTPCLFIYSHHMPISFSFPFPTPYSQGPGFLGGPVLSLWCFPTAQCLAFSSGVFKGGGESLFLR